MQSQSAGTDKFRHVQAAFLVYQTTFVVTSVLSLFHVEAFLRTGQHELRPFVYDETEMTRSDVF